MAIDFRSKGIRTIIIALIIAALAAFGIKVKISDDTTDSVVIEEVISE